MRWRPCCFLHMKHCSLETSPSVMFSTQVSIFPKHINDLMYVFHAVICHIQALRAKHMQCWFCCSLSLPVPYSHNIILIRVKVRSLAAAFFLVPLSPTICFLVKMLLNLNAFDFTFILVQACVFSSVEHKRRFTGMMLVNYRFLVNYFEELNYT